VEDLKTDMMFDIIYTSSPSNWMNINPFNGIPDSFIRFLNSNLKDDGLFIARIYGGLHTFFVIRAKFYMKRIIDTTTARGYKILGYSWDKDDTATILTVVKNGSSRSSNSLTYHNPDTTWFRDGVFTDTAKIRFFPRLTDILRLDIYILCRLVLDIFKAIINVFHLFWVNSKLLFS
jgi:hypothetical protein